MNRLLTQVCLALCLFLSLTHSTIAASANNVELQIFKAQAEAKFDAAKESQQKDLQLYQQLVTSQNERIEQINHQVDWLGDLIALGSLIITLLLVIIGYFAYSKAKDDAKDIAQVAAKEEAYTTSKAEVKKWFDDNLSAINSEISELRDRLSQLRSEVDAHAKQVHLAMDRINTDLQAHAREIIAKNPLPDDSKPTLTEADKNVLAAADNSLQDRPESTYTYFDWNTRAFAAYSEGNFALAAEYWRKAAQSRQATDEQVSIALVNQGVALGKQNKHDEESACYQQIIQRFGDSTLPALQKHVAIALNNQCVQLSQQSTSDEVGACYQQVIQRFGNSTLPDLQTQVAIALNNQAVFLGERDEFDKSIACAQQVIQRFGNSTLIDLQEQVGFALNNQAVSLGKQNKQSEKLACHQQVIQRFEHSPSEKLQGQVATALNGIGFAQVINAKEIWSKEEERTRLLTESLSLFKQSQEKNPPNDLKAVVLGNVAYALWLLGREAEVEAPLREALTMGGEKIFNGEIEDTKISTVPIDSDFEQLVTRLWSEISCKPSSNE